MNSNVFTAIPLKRDSDFVYRMEHVRNSFTDIAEYLAESKYAFKTEDVYNECAASLTDKI